MHIIPPTYSTEYLETYMIEVPLDECNLFKTTMQSMHADFWSMLSYHGINYYAYNYQTFMYKLRITSEDLLALKLILSNKVTYIKVEHSIIGKNDNNNTVIIDDLAHSL